MTAMAMNTTIDLKRLKRGVRSPKGNLCSFSAPLPSSLLACRTVLGRCRP